MTPSTPSHLVDAATLADHLTDPAWVLFDCRFALGEPAWGITQYASGHIPGARYAHLERDLSSTAARWTGRHPLPDPDALASKLGHWGLHAGAQAVVYDEGAGPSRHACGGCCAGSATRGRPSWTAVCGPGRRQAGPWTAPCRDPRRHVFGPVCGLGTGPGPRSYWPDCWARGNGPCSSTPGPRSASEKPGTDHGFPAKSEGWGRKGARAG